jgi:hypothetical protein
MSETELTLLEFEKKISQAKKKLIKVVRRKGLYENFGQKEARELGSMAMRIVHDGSRPMEERTKASRLINEFEDWVMEYSP